MRLRRAGRLIATSIIRWYLSLQKQWQITLVVFLLHAVLLLWMTLDYWIWQAPPKPHPLVVRTLAQPSHSPAPTQKRTVNIPLKEKEPVRKTPAPAKPKPAAPTNKPQKPKPPSSPKQPSHKTLGEVPTTLSSPPPLSKSSAPLSCPAPVEMSIPAPLFRGPDLPDSSSTSSSYGTHLAQCLQEQLQLPEFGQITLRITLRNPGHITSIEILDAKSKKNEEWLKKQLPLLELPCFNDFGVADASLDFTITFRNAENLH